MDQTAFFAEFSANSRFRADCIKYVQNTDPDNTPLLNNLVCLSAIRAWRDGKQGKSKAAAIQIVFFIPVRGGGAPNPYRVSIAGDAFYKPDLDVLNAAIINVHKGIHAVKADYAQPAASAGGLKKIGLTLHRKVTAGKRKIASDLFDRVEAWLQISTEVADFIELAQPAMGVGMNFVNNKWIEELRTILGAGIPSKQGAVGYKAPSFDIADLGLS